MIGRTVRLRLKNTACFLCPSYGSTLCSATFSFILGHRSEGAGTSIVFPDRGTLLEVLCGFLAQGILGLAETIS